MKNTLIGLAVIIVIVGGMYLYRVNTADAPLERAPAAGNNGDAGPSADTSMPSRGPVVVTYTEGGYSPASVTLIKGQTVRFMNGAGAETWPASAIHPTHGVYPEKSAANCRGSSFDACRGLKKGESWDFTFNQVGTWRFHDHLHAQHTGTIVVEE